jgi:CheY-like chemotaxis protein
MDTGIFKRELNILHVEDDAVEAMNLQRIFRKLDVRHRLHSAANGEIALAKLRDTPSLYPDIILLDLHMPLMDGLEFLQVLRSDPALRSITVYVLTSSDLPFDRERALHLDVASYLVKPFTPEKYKEVIVQLLSIWESADFPRRA